MVDERNIKPLRFKPRSSLKFARAVAGVTVEQGRDGAVRRIERTDAAAAVDAAALDSTRLQRVIDGHQAPAIAAPETGVTGRPPAGEVVLAYLDQQVAAIVRNDPLVRRDEPDAVHQMRVATRRARSALRAFGQIIEPEATRPLGEELKWLAAVLGQARDSEVLLARVAAELGAIPRELLIGPAAMRLTEHFTAQLAEAGKAVLHALDGRRYLRLLKDLDLLIANPPLTPLAKRNADEVLAKPLRRSAGRLQRALAAIASAEDQDVAIHEARKATKRARYAAEAAIPALGGKARRQAAKAKELQELLGNHHDSVVARTVLLELADRARAAGEDTFAYGVLHQRQACQAADIERALPHLLIRSKK